MKEKKILQIQQYMSEHPIFKEKIECRIAYLSLVEHICRKYSGEDAVWEQSIICLMRDVFIPGEKLFPVDISKNNCIICNREQIQIFKYIIRKYKYNILTDCLFIDAFESKITGRKILLTIEAIYAKNKVKMKELFQAFYDRDNKTVARKYPQLINIYQVIEQNRKYLSLPETKIIITATMSAGKSTLLNALVGKKINKAQNQACTAKIHYLYNKAGEDDFTGKWDDGVNLNVSNEDLLKDSQQNMTDNISVGTRFHSAGEIESKICFIDTPGVNFSGDATHKEITERVIQSKDYNLLLYVMNATQLATNDEIEHLNFVKKVTDQIPVVFIINKIDDLDIEEEDFVETIKHQKKMLIKKGFKNPIICPVSAKAGYLAKRYRLESLSRSEEREFYNYIDKFEQMKLSEYYETEFKTIHICDLNKEEEQLLKTCGLLYVEKIIDEISKGENKNGTGVCKL